MRYKGTRLKLCLCPVASITFARTLLRAERGTLISQPTLPSSGKAIIRAEPVVIARALDPSIPRSSILNLQPFNPPPPTPQPSTPNPQTPNPQPTLKEFLSFFL